MSDKGLAAPPLWHIACLYIRAGSHVTSSKSGRSKKGGAGTSVRLRKLRGRSTTSQCKRPVSYDGPFAFHRESSAGKRTVGNYDSILVRIEILAGRKRKACEAYLHSSVPSPLLATSERRGGKGTHTDTDLPYL